MDKGRTRRFPRWLFAILAAGGLVASGIYIGMMRLEGATTGQLVRAIVYGVFGLLMLWGAVGKTIRSERGSNTPLQPTGPQPREEPDPDQARG